MILRSSAAVTVSIPGLRPYHSLEFTPPSLLTGFYLSGMRAETDQGIELVMTKFFDINTLKTKFRVDTLYGVVNKQPEMSGVIMFGQP